MPRRKLDVSQAFAALSRQAALPQDDIVIIEPEPPKSNRGKFSYDGRQSRTINKTTEEIILHNQHAIGCGGLTGDGSDATVHYYGPGRCIVPSEHAAALLHQDQYAKAVDERVLDTTTRYYQIMPMRSPSGIVYKGIRVGDLDFTRMFYQSDQSSLTF